MPFERGDIYCASKWCILFSSTKKANQKETITMEFEGPGPPLFKAEALGGIAQAAGAASQRCGAAVPAIPTLALAPEAECASEKRMRSSGV